MPLDLTNRLLTLESRVAELQSIGKARGIRARVRNTTDQTLTTGVPAVITFDTERYDTDIIHSTSVNTSRFTIPFDGWYLVSGCVRFASNATGQRTLGILLNNTTVITQMTVGANTSGVTEILVTTVYQCVTGDYLELRCTQTSGGNLNVTAVSAISPEFWIEKLIN